MYINYQPPGSPSRSVPHNTNNGISLNSLLEQKYSPSNTIIIMPNICIIHQSQVDGKPPYIEHNMMCIMNSVTEKSKHFFDFSTINANSNALNQEEKAFYLRLLINITDALSEIIGTHPITLDINTAPLSTQPVALQISKYLAVNIRSMVMLAANST